MKLLKNTSLLVPASACALAIAAGTQACDFNSHVQYDAGVNPLAFAFGDLDGDHDLDVAIVDRDAEKVRILINNGNGTYIPREGGAEFDAGPTPVAIAIADVDEDGNGDLDLIVVNQDVDTVTLLQNDGTGAFTQWLTPLPTGDNPIAVACGDIDGNGQVDIVVANYTDDDLRCFWRGGSGWWFDHTGGEDLPTGTAGAGPISVAVGDLDHEHGLDIAAANYWGGAVGNVAVFRNIPGSSNDYREFDFGPSVFARSGPRAVVIADLNRDGWNDLAVANQHTDNVTVHRNNGPPPLSFWWEGDFTTGSSPMSLVAADISCDGWPDLLTANYLQNKVSCLENDGGTNFLPCLDSQVGYGPVWIGAGDVDQDGEPDIGVINTGNSFTDHTLSILRNRKNLARFPAPFRTIYTNVQHGFRNPIAIGAADFDQDGDRDLVVAFRADDMAVFYRNDGLGNYVEYDYQPLGSHPMSLAVGDLDNDNYPDVAVACRWGNSVTVLHNDGTGTGYCVPVADFPVSNAPMSVAIGELDNPPHGIPDLDIAVSCVGYDEIWMLENHGGMNFYDVADPDVLAEFPWSMCLDDFDGDGDLDAATANRDTVDFSLVFNDGPWQFSTRVVSAPELELPVAIASWHDLDFDGSHPDVAITDGGYQSVVVFYNDSTQSFTRAAAFPVGQMPRDLAIGDLDWDLDNPGIREGDIVVTNQDDDTISILFYNDATAEFQPQVVLPATNGPWDVVVADLDNDCDLDIAVTNMWSHTVEVYLNSAIFGPDVNGDYWVDIDDLFLVLGSPYWGTACPPCTPEDANGDGTVDVDDVFMVLNNWGPTP